MTTVDSRTATAPDTPGAAPSARDRRLGLDDELLSHDRHDRRVDAATHHSLASTLRDLRDEAVTLVQQEFLLARTEIAEEVESAKRAVTASLIGAGLALIGLFTLAIAATAGLYALLAVWADVGNYTAGWLAPLIVGLVLAGIGWAMTNRLKRVGRSEHWRPARTERSLRETKRWAERKA